MSLVRFLKTGAAMVDPQGMTELTATVQMLTQDAALVAPRDLTSHEHADLDRLRAPLAGDVDRKDSRALSWFWDRVVPAQPGTPAPSGLVEWVGVALGDLLVTHVPGSSWVVCPGPAGPTLGVVGEARPLAPVVPLADAQDCWRAGSRGWIAGYLGAAAAHLAGMALPQPRSSTENHAPATPAQALAATPSADWAPVVVPEHGRALPCRGHAATAAAAQVTTDLATEPTSEPASQPVSELPQPVSELPRPVTDAAPEHVAGEPAPEPVAAERASAPAAAEPAPAPVGEPAPVAEPASVGEPEPAPVAAEPAPEHAPAEPVRRPAPEPVPEAAAPVPPQLIGSPRPTTLPHPPSTAAQDLALRALEHALVVLRRGPFDREAFVMLVDDSGTRTLACTGEPSQALARARDTARTSGARTAAIGWIERHPTGIPDPRQAFPAVLVEASEAGAPGLKVAHRFVEDALGTGPLGDPVLVGEVEALL